ncbi:acetoacetyl-CoA reductase [Thioalkalivibrio sulfidiphilus HL-EbGr7]|uniref:Acetoacetyl-CoA reductase n=1 Tax=Thioalkalivibrio sulfidiphilus (strain HL-EbGR7) TaxID=396588 RepID=B8GRP5_THISH|nr:acetoacetyl-CoA reductase [Thioalkalivibrio sulfidiphilus]ACL72599.1 acetoacetyl-CoA reductase [Thioalkalivibrio sulfidiphilus HL-EbGr7]
MCGDLKNKVALVTGGTGGIGTAICARLSDLGCRVATTYRNREKAEAWQAQMKQSGHQVTIYACDVGDYEACVQLAETIEKDLGPVDILVNNAGITRDTTLKKMTPGHWREVICADLDSVFNMTQPLLPRMAERGWGRVINISSINGQKGQFGQANYSAAKAGMHGFTMAAAQEVARKGVTVNTISPGYIATEMVMAVPEEVREKIIAQIPVGRLGRPEEVAHVVAFLASEHAGFITGANFAANGGQHMH